jgi:hypothetical protein
VAEIHTGVPPEVGEDPASVREGWRIMYGVISGLLDGKINALGDITLAANVATTTLSDRRIGPSSCIYFMPTTANGAAEIGAATMYVSARAQYSATITHANNAQTDRTFRYSVLG